MSARRLLALLVVAAAIAVGIPTSASAATFGSAYCMNSTDVLYLGTQNGPWPASECGNFDSRDVPISAGAFATILAGSGRHLVYCADSATAPTEVAVVSTSVSSFNGPCAAPFGQTPTGSVLSSWIVNNDPNGVLGALGGGQGTSGATTVYDPNVSAKLDTLNSRIGDVTSPGSGSVNAQLAQLVTKDGTIATNTGPIAQLQTDLDKLAGTVNGSNLNVGGGDLDKLAATVNGSQQVQTTGDGASGTGAGMSDSNPLFTKLDSTTANALDGQAQSNHGDLWVLIGVILGLFAFNIFLRKAWP